MSCESTQDRRAELLETAQRLAGVGGWEYDLDAERLDWTEGVGRLFGLPPASEPPLDAAIERFHPADQPAVRSTIEAARTGESFDAEWRLDPAAGDQRWVRVRGEPHREAGSVVRIRGSISEITARKQQTALAETSRALLDASTTEAVASCAVDGAHEMLGRSVAVVYLSDAERNTLRPAAARIAVDSIETPSPVDPSEGVVWQAFECGELQVDDSPRENATAETAVRRELAVPLGDHGVLLVGSTRPAGFDDRTRSLARELATAIEPALDRLARETDLRESADRLDTLIQQTPDALFVLDESGRIVEANKQAYASLGYDVGGDDDQLLGSQWSTFGTVVDGSESTNGSALAALRENPESVITVKRRHTRRDGSTFPVRVRIAHVDGEGFLAVARDRSEHAAQQRQLRRQNEQLEQFASVISHDLRSPLSVAQAGVEVARRTGEGHGDSLDRATQAHERMKTLIEKLLRLARNGQTLAEADLEAVALSDIVHRSWQTVDTETAALAVAADCRVVADEPRLRQLVENLLRNSVDHGAPSSRPQVDDGADDRSDQLTVRVGPLADGFYIEDDGRGIAEAERERIFEPGYTTSEEGTGYGLQIVRTVAEAHGWELSVGESTTGGARFEITGIEDAATAETDAPENT